MRIISIILSLAGILLFIASLLYAAAFSDLQILGLSFGAFLVFFSVMLYNTGADSAAKPIHH